VLERAHVFLSAVELLSRTAAGRRLGAGNELGCAGGCEPVGFPVGLQDLSLTSPQAGSGPDTLFPAASNTKAMTTLLLAELVDERKLQWDEPVTEVYPDFRLGDADTTRQVLVKHLTVFRMNDGLFDRATGQSAIPIFPSAPNEFFAKVAGISIGFTRDPMGVVNGLVLHQNGDRAAPKLSASELPPEPKEIALDAATLGDYVGKYRFDFGAVFDVALKSDHLEAQLTGQATFPIFASAKDKFFYKVVDAQLDFARNAVGEVVAVVLHQNGRDMRAPRVTNQR